MKAKRVFKFLVRATLPVLLLAATAAGQSPTPADQTRPTPRSVVFTITGKDVSALGTLRMTDLRLSVDGKPRSITTLDKQTNFNLALAVLIDNSVSQQRTLGGQKLAADMFLQRVMRGGSDRGAVVSFSNDATIEQPLTTDIAALRQALTKVNPGALRTYYPGVLVSDPRVLGLPKNAKLYPGSTAVWDAVWATSEDLFATPIPDAKNVIILLSDGHDTSSRMKLRDAVAQAARANVVIYAIGIGDRDYGVAKDDLNKLATRTGGRSFFPKEVKDLDNIFAEIETELRSQYRITFDTIPGEAALNRNILIEFVDPQLKSKKWRVNVREQS